LKPPPFDYHRADSEEEAVALLAEYGDDAKVLAGGQSLVPLLSLRLARPAHVVDINHAIELSGITNGAGLTLGAMVRHRAIERSADVRRVNPLLPLAVRFIGHTAIRTRGTIGGSLAHADPAAELPTVLTVLDGSVEAHGPGGTRVIPADQLFEGFLTTSLRPDELLTAVRLPAWPAGTGWSFQEFSRRSGDFAIVGVAATVQLDGHGHIAQARLAFSGVDSTTVRASAAESTLTGANPSPELWAGAAREAAAPLEPANDLHGSAAYRRHLAAVLGERALTEAHRRATEDTE
jgi:aerobic carbon-monoxide dehydrogenase medium subunit